jgi:hypothetical protein
MIEHAAECIAGLTCCVAYTASTASLMAIPRLPGVFGSLASIALPAFVSCSG